MVPRVAYMIEYYPKTSVRNLSMMLQKVNVMIVDPDPRISSIIKHVLMSLGFGEIILFTDSLSAVEHFKKNQVDFIITDLDPAPVEGEWNFIQFLRRSPNSPNPRVPIIMLTAHAELPEVEAARDLGITEFAAKPFTAKSLCDRIVKIVENPRSFIITKIYAGPDRRRRETTPPSGQNKRKDSDQNTLASSIEGTKPQTFFERLLGKKS